MQCYYTGHFFDDLVHIRGYLFGVLEFQVGKKREPLEVVVLVFLLDCEQRCHHDFVSIEIAVVLCSRIVVQLSDGGHIALAFLCHTSAEKKKGKR